MRKNFFLNRETLIMRKSMHYFVFIGAAFKIVLLAAFIAGCAKEGEKDKQVANNQLAASIAETFPSNLADTVYTNSVIAVTFKSTAKPSEVSASIITLKQGTTPVPGTVGYSGKVVTFTPSTDLMPDTKYIATLKSQLKSGSDESGQSWSFKTGKHRHENDLSIVSVIPLINATSVPITVQPSATFSKKMELSKIKAMTFTLKQGTTIVEGTISYSGNTATFIPKSSLLVNTVYTVTINSKGESDDDGEDDHNESAKTYSWSFTTTGGGVDVTAPTILSAMPANNSTGAALSAHPEVTFSEAMNATTINTTTFTLKQGTTAVAGTVSFFGTTATFFPSASLTTNTVYTASVNTGAKDLAGNAIAGIYTWSFATGAAVDATPPTVLSVIPANSTTGVANSIHPAVTFSEAMNATTINTTNYTLKQGATSIAGTVAYTGNIATFTPSTGLLANTVYTASITTGAKDVAGNAIASVYTWSFTTAAATDVTPPTVLSTIPANNATGIAGSIHPSATFSEAMNATTINTTNFTLKQGTTAIAGSVAYTGTTATFTPSSGLLANTVYTASITTGAKDVAGNAIASAYTWSFTTASAADVTPPTVLSSVPANNATGIASSIHPSVTFSEAMNATTINTSNFTLKQGTTAVAGTVAYSGTTAIFTPSAGLMASTVYTGTITTGAKDVAGNAIAVAYTWSFTTAAAADVTAPTVLSVVPASGATSVAVNSNITATFSEAMNTSTITTTTFTLKQGTIAVAGLVSYSGTTATFNPAGDLNGNTTYTATITTGAKDLAGNAIATSKVWSFTTVATVAVTSFSTQVMPILQAKCTPCHGASSPSAGISITNYTTVSNLSNSQLDNANMYTKLGVTPAEQAIIKAWIAAGRPNN